MTSSDNTQPEEKEVSVTTTKGQIPFSVGYLSKTLRATGLSADKAYSDATSISEKVRTFDQEVYTASEIMEFTRKWYGKDHAKLQNRIRIVENDLEEIKPFVLLLAGVTGIGKTTISQMVASRLGIRTIMGTDLIRETMRVTISSDLVPTLHESSYLAYTKLDTSFLPALSKHIVGFEEQARSVTVGIEAAIDQAIRDNDIVIIEGVHLVPGLLKKKILSNPRVAMLLLYLEDEDTHESRLKIRESRNEHRGTTYSKYFKEIRDIQSYLIKQADKNNIEKVEVSNDEETLLKIINTIWETYEKEVNNKKSRKK